MCPKDGATLEHGQCPVCRTLYLSLPTPEEAAAAFVDALTMPEEATSNE